MSSSPVNLPPSCSRRTVTIVGQGRSFKQPLDVDPRADVVEPQLDELRPLLAEVLLLGEHVLVTATTDGDANHEEDAGVRMLEAGKTVAAT